MQIRDQIIGSLCKILRIRRGYMCGAQLHRFNENFNKMGLKVIK